MTMTTETVQLDLFGKSNIDILEEKVTKQHEEYDRFRRHHFWSNAELLKIVNTQKTELIEVRKELEDIKNFVGMSEKKSQCQVYCLA